MKPLEKKDTESGPIGSAGGQGAHASVLAHRIWGWTALPALPAETSVPVFLGRFVVPAEGGALWNSDGDIQTERGARHRAG